MVKSAANKAPRVNRRSSGNSAQAQTSDVERARLTAIEHCLFHYPTLFTAGMPRRLPLSDSALWIVPVVLTHPERGTIGEVGVVAVDARTGKVAGSTPRAEVVAAGELLVQGKQLARHSPSLQARS